MRSMRDLLKRLKIDGKARDALRQFNMPREAGQGAISVKSLAESLGLAVERIDLPYRMEGRLVLDPFSDSGYRIEVNRRITVQKQRFAVLHELGHYFLHTKNNEYIGDPLYLDRSESAFYVDVNEEREANQFAEVLLFADGALRAAMESKCGDVSKVAHYFGVSETVVKIALKRFL